MIAQHMFAHRTSRSVTEGRSSMLGSILFSVYALEFNAVRRAVFWLVLKLEGGQMYSLTARRLMQCYHGVRVGLYTIGAPFVPGAFQPGTTIGRFCSIYQTVRGFNANHPMNLKSTHAVFYNPALGLVGKDLIERPPVAIRSEEHTSELQS